MVVSVIKLHSTFKRIIFKAPKPVTEFLHGSTGSVATGLTSVQFLGIQYTNQYDRVAKNAILFFCMW